MNVGIIGCGFIGTEIAQFIDKGKDFKLIGLNDTNKSKAHILIKKLKINKPELMSLNDLIQNSDLIIESASKDIIQKLLQNKNLDKKNKKLLIMSTGGLVQNLNLLNGVKNCEILLPSGAISGLDAIKSVSGRIKSLTLTTTKTFKSLEGAPFIIKNNIKLNKTNKKILIFYGNLVDAVDGFPQNINVAATLFLASKFENITIKIIADPNTKFNIHEIIATGDFGKISAITQNLPSKNPRTSHLAVLSAIQTIKNIKNNIKIGS